MQLAGFALGKRERAYCMQLAGFALGKWEKAYCKQLATHLGKKKGHLPSLIAFIPPIK
jgi:hypothetical protein